MIRTMLYLLIASRLLTLGLYPLMDKTEARYAEIARLMVETGNWLTPHLDASTVFWGKPPLSFWMTSLSFEWLGVSEFSARLPMLLCVIVTMYLLYQSARLLCLREPLWAPLLFIASPVGYLLAGAVMTDAVLVLGLTLALYACLLSLIQPHHQPVASILLGLGLAIGMLSKGPVTLLFVFGPLCVFGAIAYWRQAPAPGFYWWRVTSVCVVLSAPWYLLAELASPGFLEYFILGEHVYRFLIPGWEGDLYGSAHQRPVGAIWLFSLLAVLPWALAGVLPRLRLKVRVPTPGAEMLLALFCLVPLLFFSLTRNVLITYVAPALPALTLLAGVFIERHTTNKPALLKRARFAFMLSPALLASAIIALHANWVEAPSEKRVIQALRNAAPQASIVYAGRVPFSARFYSRGTARSLDELTQSDLASAHWLLDKRRRDALPHGLSSLSRQYSVYWLDGTGNAPTLSQIALP